MVLRFLLILFIINPKAGMRTIEWRYGAIFGFHFMFKIISVAYNWIIFREKKNTTTWTEAGTYADNLTIVC